MQESDPQAVIPIASSSSATPIGMQLKAAREAAGMSIKEAAENLHIDSYIVTAIEENDEEKLPARVFTIGYMKNYAKLMNLPVDLISTSGYSLPTDNQPLPSLNRYRPPQIRQQVSSSHLGIKFITWLIIFGLLALLVFWWKGLVKLPVIDDELQVGSEYAPGETFLQPEEDNLFIPLGGIDNTSDIVLMPQAVNSPVAASISTPAVTTNDALLSSVEQAATTSGDISNIQEQPEIPAPETDSSLPADTTKLTAITDDEQPETGLAQSIVINFSERCWVEVRDGKNRIILSGEIKPGSREEIRGEKPFSFILGNARGVELLVDNEVYDLSQHTNGNVARFSLGDEGS
jgi:cytoskeleton protein RodZ